MPATFRRALGKEAGKSLVVTLLDGCLAVYPAEEWEKLEVQLRGLPAFSKPVKALTRLLASRASDCPLDSQGRILLPLPLRQGAGLRSEAVVVGVLNRFEVWGPEAWESFVHESERLLDDVSLDIPWPLPQAAPSPSPPPTEDPRPQGKPHR